MKQIGIWMISAVCILAMNTALADEGKTIFYGLEDITTQNVFWKTFSLIKPIRPTFIQFHKLPAHTLHGVVTRVDL